VDEQWEDDNYLYYSNIFVWGGPVGQINLKFSETEGDSHWGYDPDTHVFSFLNTIENVGPSVSGEFRVRHYLYSPSVGYISLYPKTISSLAASGKYPINESYDLDSISNLPDGDYSVVAFIDDQEIITETDETDNFGSFVPGAAPMFFYTNSTKANLSDYTDGVDFLNSISLEYYPDYHYIGFSGTIANYGVSNAPPFQVGFYISEDTNIDPSEDYFLVGYNFPLGLAETSVERLYNGQTVYFDLDAFISEIPPGTYYFGYYIDDQNTVDEYTETDNSLCFGEPSEAIEWTVPYCQGDYEPDGDIDGLDLYFFAYDLNAGIYQNEDIPLFASNFGRNTCASHSSGASAMSQLSIPVESSLITNNSESVQTTESKIVSSTTIQASSLSSKINWKPIEVIEKKALTQETETSKEIFSVKEVNWTSASGQKSTAIGDIEWLITNIQYSESDSILVSVTDAMGNVEEKTIKLVYEEIFPLDSKHLPQKWLRRFNYTYTFDEKYLQATYPSAAEITLFCWPDEIKVIDDYNVTENPETSAQTGENNFRINWNILCDSKQKDILFLDIPVEEFKTE